MAGWFSGGIVTRLWATAELWKAGIWRTHSAQHVSSIYFQMLRLRNHALLSSRPALRLVHRNLLPSRLSFHQAAPAKACLGRAFSRREAKERLTPREASGAGRC